MSSSGGSDSAGDARDAAMGMGGKTRNTSPTSFSGGDDNREQRITNQYTSPEGIAVASRDPSFGDPDPQVDVSPQERDSITSFLDNYSANLRASPLMVGAINWCFNMVYIRYYSKLQVMLMVTAGYKFLDGTYGTVQMMLLELGQRNEPDRLARSKRFNKCYYSLCCIFNDQALLLLLNLWYNNYFAQFRYGSGQSPLSVLN